MRKNCTTCKHDRLKTPICDECYHTSDAPTKWEAAEHYKPDTNADRIRAMSDEELAKWIDDMYCQCVWCDVKKDDCNDTKCTECIEKWLKQPADPQKGE